jgi:acetoin utilization deacetylase AcuC-like enzyme
LVQHERFQHHLTGPAHPERPERLARIASVLAERGLTDVCTAIEAAPVDMKLVQRIHDAEYLERLQHACAEHLPFIDAMDSAICPETYVIAQLATGAVINAVDDVMARRIENAFCAIRPPGHHTERDRSMGFCMFNNIAIAARHLIDDHGLERILILDWDVHHGNGTQHTFEADPRVLFISLHGHPHYVYPGTGFEHEQGSGPGEGFTINLPMMPQTTDDAYHRAFDDPIMPAIASFDPQFVLVSAGFDAHRADPLAPLELETECYGWMTGRLTDVAKKHCQGRIVSLLEGGYDLDALGDSVALHVTRLLEA